MNAQDVMVLGRWVRAAFPHQKLDQYTLDVWLQVLSDVDPGDAMAAARDLAGKQQFIAPADIISGVRRIRRDRLERAVVEAPDVAWDASPREYIAALRAGRTRAADGTERLRPVAELLSGATKTIDAA